jgi:hypothetical protein
VKGAHDILVTTSTPAQIESSKTGQSLFTWYINYRRVIAAWHAPNETAEIIHAMFNDLRAKQYFALKAMMIA